MDSVGIDNVGTRSRVSMMRDSLSAGMEEVQGSAEDTACVGVAGRVINVLQVIAGETIPAEAVALARERIARAAALDPSACIADYVRHLSDVAGLSSFLDRINNNILHGDGIAAFFSWTRPDGPAH